MEENKKERQELIKLLNPLFNLAILSAFVYLTKCVYIWVNIIMVGGILAAQEYQVIISTVYFFILMIIFTGAFDDYIKQNIDPSIIKMKNWLNRRNQ